MMQHNEWGDDLTAGVAPLSSLPLRRSLCWALALAGLVGCARRNGGPAGVPAESGTIITQEKIAASGARTAWDALRLTAPSVQLRESRGKAARVQRRGRASIYLDDQVRVFVDHVQLHDLQMLQQMPAADIYTIQVLSGLDATTYYGGGSTSGVVLITTMRH
jgi:outer membrane cobalamin receptor